MNKSPYVIAGMVLILNGCVTLPRHRREIRETRIETMQKMRKVAHYQHCDDAVRIISGRIDVAEMKE